MFPNNLKSIECGIWNIALIVDKTSKGCAFSCQVLFINSQTPIYSLWLLCNVRHMGIINLGNHFAITRLFKSVQGMLLFCENPQNQLPVEPEPVSKRLLDQIQKFAAII